jgi:hypothetical protein
MPSRRLPTLAAAFMLSSWIAAPLAAQPPATPPPPVPAGVLTTLTVKPGVQRADVMRVMVEEARHTLALHLDGRILQWWGLGDGRGVVFVLKGATVEDAKTITDTLPLTRAGLVDFQYVPLTTITPLRILLAAPGAAPR